MLADTGNDNACALLSGFLCHDVCHYLRVLVVKMRYWLITKQEVEGLHKGSNHGYSLLLTKAHQADRRRHLVGNTESLEPSFYLFSLLMMRQAVFYFDVLHCRQFREEAQLLEKKADVLLSQLYPFLYLKPATILSVEENLAVEVLSVADNETAKRTLSCAALSLYEVGFALLEGNLLPPDIALDVSPLQENLGESVV